MPSSQVFKNAYEITAPTGGAFSIQFKSGGPTKTNVTVSDTGTGADNLNVLGDVAGDAVTTTGMNNASATYFGIGTVNGVQGLVIFDSQAGGKYFLLTSATIPTTTTSGTAAVSSAGTNTWTLAGTAAPAAPVITGVSDDAAPATGTVPNGGATNDTTPTVAGTAAAGSTITVSGMVGGVTTTLGTTTADASGAWTFTTTALGQGTHSISATATGSDGASTSPASAAYAVTVDTAPDADVVVDLTDASAAATTASVAFNLNNLDAGSTATVTFAGSGGGTATVAYTSGGAKTADVSGLQGDITATVSVTDAAGNVAAGQGETLAGDPVCFYPGTLVATPAGERAVETLEAGDLVLTSDGGAAPIRWLGRQTVSTRFADPLRVLPVRVAAGALGENLPKRDLLVSPDHALLVDGVLVQAGALVDGRAIRRETAVPEVFTYWHVELADHALVLAEGVPAETFIDNVSRKAFDNWGEHDAAERKAPVAEMALPRAKSRRQVPAVTRRRLAGRAALLAAGERTAAA